MLAFAVAAGPCQACFDVPVKSSAHGCCPSQKETQPHQHNSSCSDVQVAVEHSKPTLEMAAAVAAPVVELHRGLVPLSALGSLEARPAPSHTPLLISVLRI